MSKLTTVEYQTPGSKSTISIKPYFDDNKQNMGLESYGLALFDGVFHEEPLTCLEQNGILRYVTGLNEFAPEVKRLPTEEREVKIREIRTIIADIEGAMTATQIDVDAKDFMSQIVLLRPDNKEFFNTIFLRCGNLPVYLHMSDPIDRIKLHAIEAGGFSMIAKSYEEAAAMAVAPKFYLDKLEFTVSTKTEYKKLKNKALSELQKLFDKGGSKLFYIAKAVDAASSQYKKNTPNDIIYDNMDKHISGEGSEKNKERAAKSFLDAVAMDLETLKIKAIIKDSTFYKFLIPKSDGFIYDAESGALLGRNLSDILEFMKNPLNEQVLISLNTRVEAIWNL